MCCAPVIGDLGQRYAGGTKDALELGECLSAVSELLERFAQSDALMTSAVEAAVLLQRIVETT